MFLAYIDPPEYEYDGCQAWIFTGSPDFKTASKMAADSNFWTIFVTSFELKVLESQLELFSSNLGLGIWSDD